MKWASLTTEEFAALDRATPVVINTAAIEQHGPHLTLRTDAAIGQHFLDRLEAELGPRVLLLPQVQVCCSDHHMDFAGTLSVSHETYLAYVGDILRSVVRHGFRNLVILNSHGGNQAVGQVLIEKLGHQHPDCRFAFTTWWRLAAPALEKIRESGPGGVNHACEFETALMLSCAPEDVRRERIGGHNNVETFAWAEGDMLIGERGALFRTMAQKSGGSGVVGDPSLGTAEKGEAITRAVVAALREIVESLAEG